MGSPVTERGRCNDETQVFVGLTRGFWLGQHPVTQGEWDQVMDSNRSFFSLHGAGAKIVKGRDTSRLPVEQVSWGRAVEFCRRLTEREKEGGRLAEGHEYRLPSEAQWEYACRAGTATAFSCGDALSAESANYNNHLRRTTEVGAYPPNPWGLCDMHGNVWEWCLDEYHRELPAGRDPLIKGSAGARRVCRGGSWNNGAPLCRSASRGQNPPGARSSLLGFRVALVSVDRKEQ
jgi:formylglycine-generating enzyme required for sulfatase activity